MLSILIVEDDRDQRETLAEYLGDRFAVTAVADGEEAVAAISTPGTTGSNRPSDLFDLIITDLRMPRLTGLELKNRLALMSIDIPMVLMSSDRALATTATGAGFLDHLSKPLSIDHLEAIVARVAAGKHGENTTSPTTRDEIATAPVMARRRPTGHHD